MNIILFGPPGAGKGTQGDALAKDLNQYKVSTGDLLRDEVKKKSTLGKKIKSMIDKGLLVPDNIINNLIEEVLSNKKYFNQLIFDGYPRNLKQTKNLDDLLKKYNQKILCVLSLKVDENASIKRILGRRVCSNCGMIFNTYYKVASISNHSCALKFMQKRSDDNEKTIINRFETYLEKTLPILDFYKQQNLLHQIKGLAENPGASFNSI